MFEHVFSTKTNQIQDIQKSDITIHTMSQEELNKKYGHIKSREIEKPKIDNIKIFKSELMKYKELIKSLYECTNEQEILFAEQEIRKQENKLMNINQSSKVS